MNWVLVANSNTCKIYEFSRKPRQLTLIHELEHPENRLKTEDLVSDRPGHYKARSTAYGSYQSPSDPKDVLIDNFAREICELLNEGRVHNQYENLTIVAADKMYGRLMHHLDKHVAHLVTHHINKDLIFLKPNELLPLLIEQTQYPEAPR